MRRYRYSAWNDSLGGFHPDPEDLLDGIADSIIEHGDLRKALRLLMQQGFTAVSYTHLTLPTKRIV